MVEEYLRVIASDPGALSKVLESRPLLREGLKKRRCTLTNPRRLVLVDSLQWLMLVYTEHELHDNSDNGAGTAGIVVAHACALCRDIDHCVAKTQVLYFANSLTSASTRTPTTPSHTSAHGSPWYPKVSVWSTSH